MCSAEVDVMLLFLMATEMFTARTLRPLNGGEGDSLIRAKHEDPVCCSFLYCATPALAKQV